MKKFEKIVNRREVLNSNKSPNNEVNLWKKLSSSIKKLYRKLKYLDKTKSTYFGVSIFLAAFCLFTGGTYSYFVFSEYLNAAVISIAKLNYSLTSTESAFEDNSITVWPMETLQLTLSLKSLNDQNTRYALDYIANSPDVKVYYKMEREQNVEGEISGLNSVIDINLVIENTGDTAQTVNFDLKGGYLQNELESNIVDKWVSTIMAVSSNTKEKLWAHKQTVQKIVFEDALIPKENAEYTYDISSDQDGSIMSYLVPSSEDETKYIAYIQSANKVKANKYSNYLFKDFTNLESIENLSLLDTSKVTDMSSMFYDCYKLTTLDISGFDTSNVTNMSFMFYKCYDLTTLDLSGFDTSNVTDMSWMFTNCNDLTTLDLSGFDTSNVTNMSSMFYKCINLITLDLSELDTSKVTDMSSMFYFCESLTTLDLSELDTSKVTNMSNMFDDCRSLTILDLSGFDTSKVTSMSEMFSDCRILTTLDVSGFNTSNVTDMSSMFYFCNRLTTLDLSGFDTSNVTDMSKMFYDCYNLTTLDVSGFDTSKVTNMSWMFRICRSLTTLDVSSFDTSKVTNMSNMFDDCRSLTILDLSGFDTSNVTDMSRMFLECSGLTTLDLSGFDTSKVTNMTYMFYDCKSLTTLNVSGFDTSNVTNMSYMFGYCWDLTTLDLSGFDMSNVTNMTYMFYACDDLSTTITIIGTKCTKYGQMFSRAATAVGTQIRVKYTADASSLVDEMIATKSSNSNVVKESQPE